MAYLVNYNSAPCVVTLYFTPEVLLVSSQFKVVLITTPNGDFSCRSKQKRTISLAVLQLILM